MISEEKFNAAKAKIRDDLDHSNHALANGITSLMDDIGKVGGNVDSLNLTVGMLNKTVTLLQDTVTKLFVIVAGNPEYHVDGLVQKGLEANSRINRVEERNNQVLEVLKERISKQEKFTAGVATIGATVMALWGVFGDAVKQFFSNKP